MESAESKQKLKVRQERKAQLQVGTSAAMTVAGRAVGTHPLPDEHRCLSKGSSAQFLLFKKRHHDHGNSSKGKHLMGVVHLWFRGLVHYYGGTWQHAGRHNAGEVA